MRVRGLLIRGVRLQVSLPVVRKFVKQVEETALGVKVVKGIKPDQQLVKVVKDQLIELMGGEQQGLVKPAKGPQVRLSDSELAQCLLSAFCTCSAKCHVWTWAKSCAASSVLPREMPDAEQPISQGSSPKDLFQPSVQTIRPNRPSKHCGFL